MKTLQLTGLCLQDQDFYIHSIEIEYFSLVCIFVRYARYEKASII